MNEVKKQTNGVVYEANGEQVEINENLVKNYLVHGEADRVSLQEIRMFISLCKYQHLNPFLNEAYIIKFGNKPAQLIVGKEAFMKRAEQNPKYEGVKAGLIIVRNKKIEYTKGAFMLPTDHLVGAWAEVKRKDRKDPHHIEISFEEFKKQKYNSKTKQLELQSTWKSMPATMIRKTAIVNALREAFPETLGGMYTEDDKDPVESNEPADTNAKQDEKGEKLARKLAKDPEEKPTPKQTDNADAKQAQKFEEVKDDAEKPVQGEMLDEITNKPKSGELLQQKG